MIGSAVLRKRVSRGLRMEFMWRDKIGLVGKIFRYRMVSGEVIPPDARVDPNRFPESRFPLYCPVCDYLLRGLPTERCPECGTPFNRGRLLVQQYVVEQGKRSWKRTGKYAKWLLIIGGLLSIAPPALFSLVTYVERISALKISVSLFDTLIPCIVTIMLTGAALLFTASILYVHLATVAKKKYAQVSQGIDRNSPSFQTAQRRKWIFWVVWLGVMIVFLAIWSARSSSVWYRYYAQAPSRMLIPVAVAVGVGIVFLTGIFLANRWQDNQDET